MAEGKRAWIELDMDALRHNVRLLRSMLPAGCELMPALKCNAYGHGAGIVASELQRLGVSAFCVASAEEGKELRRAGIRAEILVLGYTHPGQFDLLADHELSQTITELSYAEDLNKYALCFNKKINVHIAVDTGMHRLGISYGDILSISAVLDLKGLCVNAVFTHLAASGGSDELSERLTKLQLERFGKVIEELGAQGHRLRSHALSSYGLLRYPEAAGNYARTGIILYGVLSERPEDTMGFKAVLSVRSRVAQLRELSAGASAGYGTDAVMKRDGKLAVVTIGYGDGIPRVLSSGRGKVLINGFEAPVFGRICMDQMLVDVSAIPDVKAGDIAVLIGRSGEKEISVYEIAEACGTITNEILSRLGPRLERIVKRAGRERH